ncbi:MAG: CHAT domain-containing protein [Candidatus Viridilinea halotolerans]|uniref:CHAT domain-containing protein n=1 Tax=Candidatus Viridilinea halotolerans TaxID=2491704 RepID=A0A426TXF1_9CHLR|nr:MAG: CHAT domain-containing protein [Candidatus Viridilinea halotolerans]
MEANQIIDLIVDPNRTLDEVAAVLEAQLPPEAIDQELLGALRVRLREEKDQALVVRGMLVGARLAPLGTASALDVYGMWLNRANPPHMDLNPLRVAAWAYRWAGDEQGRALALVNLAEGLFVRDEFAAAMATAQSALTFFLQAELEAGIVKAKLVQANTFVELQQFPQADAIFKELAASVAVDYDDPDDVVRHVEWLNIRAFAVENLCDDFAYAHQIYQQAEAALPLTGTPQPFVGSLFRLALNQGLREQRLGRHAEARRYFEAAERSLQEGLAAKFLTNADAFDLRQQQLILALLLDDRAWALTFLAQLEALVAAGEDSLKQRAELLRFKALLSDRFEQCVAEMQQAIAAFRKQGLDLLVLACSSQLAERAYEAGRHDVAAQALAQAYAVLAGHAAPRRLLELRRITAQYDPALPHDTRVATAQELAHAGDLVGAAAVWEMVGRGYEQAKELAAARDAYGHALEAAARAHGMVRLSLHTLRLGAARRRAAERSFVLAPDEPTAFGLSEQLRAQTLLDELSNAGLWRLLDHEDLREIKDAYEQLSYAQASLSLREVRVRRPLLTDSPSADASTLIRRQQAEAAYFAALQRIHDAKVIRAGWISGQPAALNAIQAALPPATLLLAPLLVGSGDAQELWATLLTNQGVPQRMCLARKSTWKGFRQRWPEVQTLATASRSDAEAMLSSLYRVFLAPLEEHLAAAQGLIIALDEALPLYPLHAAFDSTHYLLERMPVSYIPSGTVLTLLRQRQMEREQASQRWVLGYDAYGEADYPQLKGVPEELARLSAALGGAFRHGPFTPDELLALSSSARSIHLMAHGAFPAAGSGRFAQLITGPRRLYADDLYRTELHADLLFLDACHSGQVGPGLQGFSGAALVSGANAVIAAMWQVEYRAARELVRTFYHHWRSGLPCASALCRAQRDLAPQHPPGEWAHFYLTGIPDGAW